MDRKELEIRLSGSGGQGILLACHILAEALTLENLKIAQSQHYEPISRGGLSRSDLVASDGSIDYPLASRLDYLVVLDQVAATASDDLLHENSVAIVDSTRVENPSKVPGKNFFLPMSDTAHELNDTRSTNMVALGALVTLGEFCPLAKLYEAVRNTAPAQLIDSSIAAIQAGNRIARYHRTE